MCASDNVAVYISLFIGMRIWEIVMTAILFYLLLLSSVASACILIQVRLTFLFQCNIMIAAIDIT